MANLMEFEVLAPDRYIYKADDVAYVEARTVDGGVGILPRHATMVATLAEAPLQYRDSNGTNHYICVDGGFLEVKNNKVTVLSVSAALPEGINAEETQAEVERAQAKLDNPDDNIDLPSVMRDLRRAKARLQTLALTKAR